MEFSRQGLGARTFLIAASIGLAACSSISDETLNGSAADDAVEVTTTDREPVITVAPTVQTTIRGAEDGADDGAAGDAGDAAAAPTTTQAPTTQAPTTQPPTTQTTTTQAPTTEGTTTQVPTTESGGMMVVSDDVEDAAPAQLQDDDEDELESLPNTGPNETMLVIAIGCALIVGGRTLIDLVNSAARALQRIPARGRSPQPPR